MYNTNNPITILIYMAADNNLDESAIRDLETIRKASLYSDIDIIVQLDRYEFVDTKEGFVYHIKSGEQKILKRLGEINSGNPDTLKNFIQEYSKIYSSNRLMVIIWSHGTGIDDRDIYHPTRDNLFVKKEEIEEIAISFDDEAKDFIDNIELQKALSVDTKIDILGFDACLMGMFEIAYQLRNQAKTIISSQYIEPITGWNYENILEEIKSDNSIIDIAKTIVNLYGDYYERDYTTATLSAYDISLVNDIAKAIDVFALELKEKLTDKKDLRYILSQVQDFNRSDYIDLGHFVELVNETFELVSTKRLSVLLQQMIIANRALGYSMENAKGVSIYFPHTKVPFRDTFDMYKKLDFSIDYPNWIKLFDREFE